MKILIAVLLSISTYLLIIFSPIQLSVWQSGIFLRSVSSLSSVGDVQLLREQTYADGIFAYLRNGDEQQLPAVMTSAERSHMGDVRRLFSLTQVVSTVALVCLILFYVLYRFGGDMGFFWQTARYGCYLSLVSLFALAVLLLLDFSSSWVYVHHIFFPQGNWMFPDNSRLVQVFDERFFKEATALWVLLSGGFSVAVLILSKLFRSQNK